LTRAIIIVPLNFLIMKASLCAQHMHINLVFSALVSQTSF
jgi:hypothetical protein